MKAMTAEEALLQLSALAADFKVGIVDDEFVREMLEAIVGGMNIDNKDAVLKRALQSWFIEDEADRDGQPDEAQRREMEAEAAERVEKAIRTLMRSGARDRVTAIRWLHDAHDTQGDDEYLCFQLGLPYGYFKEPVSNPDR